MSFAFSFAMSAFSSSSVLGVPSMPASLNRSFEYQMPLGSTERGIA